MVTIEVLTGDKLIEALATSHTSLNIYSIKNENVAYKIKQLQISISLKYLLEGKTLKECEVLFHNLNEKVVEARHKIFIKKSKDSEERRIKREKAAEERAKHFKSILKPGQIVKFAGTNDHVGHRLVLELGEHRVTCRKLLPKPYSGKNVEYWTKDSYISEHEYDKARKILKEPEEAKELIR